MRWAAAILLTLVLVCVPATAMAAVPLTAAEAVEQGLALDGTRITLGGEAIGEDLRADDGHRWVNVRSGGTALGVFAANSNVAVVGTYGSYATTGDTLLVTGILNVACDEHAGEFDLHAEQIVVVAPGERVEHPVQWWKGVVGLIAGILGIVEWRVFVRLREREGD